LSAAAKRRGVAVSTLSRRMEALEAALKLRLVDRQGRGTQLTEHGKQIAALAEPISDQPGRVIRAADALRAGSQSLPVRVSATEIVVSDILAPQLPKLWESGARFPLHLQSEPDVISLAARDADLAVRMSRPKGASLIARKLPSLRPGFFASPDYLDGRDPAGLDLRGGG
jgi:DNA-binding transcriptional LysR family regulator